MKDLISSKYLSNGIYMNSFVWVGEFMPQIEDFQADVDTGEERPSKF